MEQKVSGASLKRQVIFWVIVLAVFIVFLYLFSSILLPFIAGMALAYFLDPVADRLEKLGLSRLMATIVILIAFVLVFALALTIFIPIIINQFNDFLRIYRATWSNSSSSSLIRRRRCCRIGFAVSSARSRTISPAYCLMA